MLGAGSSRPGPPPLLVGFLRGVDFFWTAAHLWRQTALTAALVLAAFVAIDIWYYRQDRRVAVVGEKPPNQSIREPGLVNLMLLFLILGAIPLSGLSKTCLAFDIF